MAEIRNGTSKYVDWRPNRPNGGLHPFWKQPIVIEGSYVSVRQVKTPQVPELDSHNFVNRVVSYQNRKPGQDSNIVFACCTNGACPNHNRTYQAKEYSARSIDDPKSQDPFLGPCVTCDEWTLKTKK